MKGGIKSKQIMPRRQKNQRSITPQNYSKMEISRESMEYIRT